MGTNYYLQEETCPHCGRGQDKLHIGKSSAGWCFSLHVMPEIDLNDLPDWKARWSKPTAIITDEYDKVLSPDEMEARITERSWKGSELGRGWFEINRAEPGPNGLSRHALGNCHCIGHGAGTYDLIKGEFS